jgi:hypothetical protein
LGLKAEASKTILDSAADGRAPWIMRPHSYRDREIQADTRRHSMGALLPLLGISERFQADLVIAATLLFLISATFGLILSSHGHASDGSAAQSQTALSAGTWRLPIRAGIIAGLLGGLAVLVISCC